MYYSDGAVKTEEFGGIEELDMVDSLHSRFWTTRVRGKGIDTVYSFSPVYGVNVLDSWFLAYGYEEDQQASDYYYNGMRKVKFVDSNESEFAKYLTGTGQATGFTD